MRLLGPGHQLGVQADPVSCKVTPEVVCGKNLVEPVEYLFLNSCIIKEITGIDPTLYEAAAIDGAGRWKQTWHVTLPGMRMIIVLMMVLSLGNVLNAGFDQVYNMYNTVVYPTGDIIDTMMYRLGLESAKFGPATAVSLLKSGVSMLFISVSYYIAIRFFDYRLF